MGKVVRLVKLKADKKSHRNNKASSRLLHHLHESAGELPPTARWLLSDRGMAIGVCDDCANPDCSGCSVKQRALEISRMRVSALQSNKLREVFSEGSADLI